MRDAAGVPQAQAGRGRASRCRSSISYPEKDDKGNFLSHPNASSVVGVHNFGWMFVQATVAILILVGFESVTAMGGEAKNAKRDVPIAVITSLLVQGAFCYLIEYFAANYFLNSGYTMQNAAGSAAPIGDMMVMVGDALFGPGNGRIFMLVRGLHRVPGDHRHHALLHEHRRARHLRHGQGRGSRRSTSACCTRKNLTPHRAIWTLAAISAVIGCIAVSMALRRRRRADRRRHQGSAAGLLVELRLYLPTTRWRRCPTRC